MKTRTFIVKVPNKLCELYENAQKIKFAEVLRQQIYEDCINSFESGDRYNISVKEIE